MTQQSGNLVAVIRPCFLWCRSMTQRLEVFHMGPNLRRHAYNAAHMR